MRMNRYTIAASSAFCFAVGTTASAALLASEDFSTYDETTPGGVANVAGDLAGQDGDNGGGDPLGFSGTAWVDAQSNTQTSRRVRVSGGTATGGSANGGTKSYNRSFDSTLADGTDGTTANDVVWIRANLGGTTPAGAFSSLVFADSAGGNTDSLRLNVSNILTVDFVTTSGQNPGAVDSASLGANDGELHEWLVKIDFAAGTGEAWLDADLSSFDGTGGSGFTLPTSFDTLTHVRIQTAGPNNQIVIDDFQIGQTASDVGAVPEPGTFALLGLGGLLIAQRRRTTH